MPTVRHLWDSIWHSVEKLCKLSDFWGRENEETTCHYYLKYSTYYISQQCPNSPSQLELLQILVCSSLQPGLVLKGNPAHSFVQRTTDITNSPISLHQLLKAGAFIFSCTYNDTCKRAGTGKKHFANFTDLDKPCSLQRTKGSGLCIKTLWKELLNKFLPLTRTRHRPVLALFWEQFAPLLALKSRVSLGTDVCMCPLSLPCSSTHLTQKFPACWKTSAVPCFWSTFSHLPSCNLDLSIFSHSWKKHPIVSLFCSGSAESQLWPAAIKAQPAETTPGKGEQLMWGHLSLWTSILPLPWNRRDTQKLNKSCFDLHNGI